MTGADWVLIIGAVAGVLGSLAAAIRAASSAYQEAIDRRARELETKRLADQAQATVKAKNEEIAELEKENARLWRMVEGGKS